MITFLVLVAAMVSVMVFAEFLIDVYCSWMDRRGYRRRTDPRNIEKNAQDLLELELQQFLLEEEIKQKAKRRMEHPASYSKTVGGGLDGSTKDILAKLTKPQNKQARMFPQHIQLYKNNWGSE